MNLLSGLGFTIRTSPNKIATYNVITLIMDRSIIHVLGLLTLTRVHVDGVRILSQIIPYSYRVSYVKRGKNDNAKFREDRIVNTRENARRTFALYIDNRRVPKLLIIIQHSHKFKRAINTDVRANNNMILSMAHSTC